MGRKKPSNKQKNISKNQSDSDFEDVNPNNENFFHDEIDRFHADKEKILLGADSEDDSDIESEEEEVLGIASDSEDDDFDDDHDGEDGEDITSSKAWGKKKSLFYGADGLEGLEGSDREEAERAEEEEVLAIQRRLAEQIDEEDFGLDILQTTKQVNDAAEEEELKSCIVADFSSLSKRAQWKLAKKESPELEGLIEDFKKKISELETEVCPLVQLIKRGKIPKGYGSDFINLKYRVYLAYLINISFYLALKTSKTPVKNHPVISRLLQYRTVINRLASVDKKLKPEIEELLEKLSDFGATTNKAFHDSNDDSDSSIERNTGERTRKRKAEPEDASPAHYNVGEFSKTMSEKMLEDTEPVKRRSNQGEEDDQRRAINDEIAKNKGLKQKKRKIDRNPRVKMRQKYRKAKIRRRGQIREYKPELKKYSGEGSGIRIGVRKSVNLQ